MMVDNGSEMSGSYEEQLRSDVAGVHLMKCDKEISKQNKCVQLVDYVAGAARA